MPRFLIAAAACLLMSASTSPLPGGLGPVVGVTVHVQDAQGERLDGVRIKATSLEREEVLLEDSVTALDGRGEVKVLTLHQFSIRAELKGFVPVTLGPTYPTLQQHLTVVMNRADDRQFVPLR
jgi:hypothetical protein